MIECGLSKCVNLKNTTVEGIVVGKEYYFTTKPGYLITLMKNAKNMYDVEKELQNGTFIILYNDDKESLPCNYSYFIEHFKIIEK